MRISRRLPGLVLAFALVAAAPVARAQELSDQDKAAAKELYEKGRAAYDQGQYDEAIKQLKQAYMVSRKSAILFNIAQTYKQLGDGPMALHFFQKFLAEADPDDQNRTAAQATVEELQAEAAKQGQTLTPAAEGQEAAPDEGKPAEAPSLPQFRHVPIGEAPPRKPVDVRIRVGEDAKGFASFLYYRGPNQETFTRLPMQPLSDESADLTARIPKKMMRSKSVQYYVETRNPDGSLYGSSGSPAKPNVIVVDPKAEPKIIAEVEEALREEAAPEGPPAWTRYYRPAKWIAAGATVVALGVTAGFAAYGARLTTDMEKRVRASSVKRDDGTWSDPMTEYDQSLEDLDQKGRQVNLITMATGITALGLGVATGVLFLLDWRRGEAERAASGDVAIAPIIGPGMGGVAGAFHF